MTTATPETTAATAAPAGNTNTVKLTVALPREAVDAIDAIAQQQRKTKTQVLREAIALKAFIEGELARPDTRILIERAGETRELVFT